MLKSTPWRATAFAATSIGLAYFANFMIRLAENRSTENLVPSPPNFDNSTEYLLGWIWALVLCFVVVLVPLANREKLTLLALWIAKVVMTLGFMLLYESIYGLDAWLYYFQVITGSGFIEDHGVGGNRAMLDTISFLLLFQPTSYHATKVSFAFIGLAAIYAFYRAAVLYLGREDLRILFFLGLFPSILFWSSILGKDPINFLGIGLYALGVAGLFKRGQVLYLIPLIAGVTLASWIRLWYLALMLGPVLMVMVFDRKFLIRIPVFVAVAALFSVVLEGKVAEVLAAYQVETIADILEHFEAHGNAFVETGSSAATISAPPNLSSISSLLSFLPFGIFAMLFRPLPGEVMNPFGLLVSLENLLLFFLLYKSVRNFSWEKMDKTIICATLYVLFWGAFHGLVVLNFGTSVRFRLQILPLLIGILFYLAYFRTGGQQKEPRERTR